MFVILNNFATFHLQGLFVVYGIVLFQFRQWQPTCNQEISVRNELQVTFEILPKLEFKYEFSILCSSFVSSFPI